MSPGAYFAISPFLQRRSETNNTSIYICLVTFTIRHADYFQCQDLTLKKLPVNYIHYPTRSAQFAQSGPVIYTYHC